MVLCTLEHCCVSVLLPFQLGSGLGRCGTNALGIWGPARLGVGQNVAVRTPDKHGGQSHAHFRKRMALARAHSTFIQTPVHSTVLFDTAVTEKRVPTQGSYQDSTQCFRCMSTHTPILQDLSAHIPYKFDWIRYSCRWVIDGHYNDDDVTSSMPRWMAGRGQCQ